eukprot:CAMPEP_0119503056 /NCGR_PEP_ID=MMETSP1344-20130328/24339_1 /TAXON_ID=236787 /ORGANISM="Florenciella parvula, Strain CCMP2471" /LENGTH=30 /DNA_ID= /DNA_START= /DNA_END= /DNA_ORIENTATION=
MRMFDGVAALERTAELKGFAPKARVSVRRR